MIKILFFRDSTLLGWLIRFWCCSKSNHVELEFPDGRRLQVIAGQHVQLLRSNRKPFMEAKIVACPVQIQQALAAASGKVGHVYDWQGVFLSQVLPFSWQNPEREFCTEAVADCLDWAGLLPDLGKPCRWSPRTFEKAFHPQEVV